MLFSATASLNILPIRHTSSSIQNHIRHPQIHCSTSAQASVAYGIHRSSAGDPLTPLSGGVDSDENPLIDVSVDVDSDQEEFITSALAVAASIRKVSTSPVEFVQLFEKERDSRIVLPSSDFLLLCMEQLDLFRATVDTEAVLTLYVRPAGSYVMDRLELRRVAFYPGVNVAEASHITILIGNFAMPAGLRATEANLSNHDMLVTPEHRAVVFPMVKHPFVVGFLVAELSMESQINGHNIAVCSENEPYRDLLNSDGRIQGIQPLMEDLMKCCPLTFEQRSRAAKISHSLAMAYVMDQKAILLQQSSCQNNGRMSNLVDQIRSSLSSIRTLSEMLSLHVKKNEVSSDIVMDILTQGNHMRNALQQLQDAVYLTKDSILRYNEETLNRMQGSNYSHKKTGAQFSIDEPKSAQVYSMRDGDPILQLGLGSRDLQMPMPPLTLAPSQQLNFRPCNVSNILADLVEAAAPLAQRQHRSIGLSELSHSCEVAVKESALRQALSNLIEGSLLRTHVGGRVEIVLTGAPAGGALLMIDDDGPDMHFMTQMHSLTPFGADLLSDDMVEDNMTWNFIAGVTVAREILETYGCVLRVVSPRLPDAALGAGGTHIELWMPAFPSDLTDQSEASEDS